MCSGKSELRPFTTCTYHNAMEGVFVADQGVSSGEIKEDQHETRSSNGSLLCVIIAVLVVLACLVTQSYMKGGWTP